MALKEILGNPCILPLGLKRRADHRSRLPQQVGRQHGLWGIVLLPAVCYIDYKLIPEVARGMVLTPTPGPASPLLPSSATPMAEPLEPIQLPPATDAQQEGKWLNAALLKWLNTEYLPEPSNHKIAHRASQVFVRQRMEGENDVGSLVMAILTEMQSFDFSDSFYGEFTVANAVSDLLLDSLGIERCCGRSTTLDPSETRDTEEV